MNGTDSLFSTIDLRSFSNLWFWLMLAVAWSNVTHFVMGVPFDMVQRAKRKGGAALALLLVPLTFAGWLGLTLAARIQRDGLHGPALVRSLIRTRWVLQAIGLLAIFLTTLWGTWHTLSMRSLG